MPFVNAGISFAVQFTPNTTFTFKEEIVILNVDILQADERAEFEIQKAQDYSIRVAKRDKREKRKRAYQEDDSFGK